MDKTQIFRLHERHVLIKSEHDELTKKVKEKVAILGAVFCRNKSLETLKTCGRLLNPFKRHNILLSQ